MTTAVELTIQRSNCFRLLAACFYEPDQALFQKEHLCENLASLLGICSNEKAAAAAMSMTAALAENCGDEMAVEYARLFVGPFELAAPPYGSVYLEKSNRLMGDSTLAVQKMYQKAGLSVEVREAPDHIALELEFMHFLCLGEAEAAQEKKVSDARKFADLQSAFMGKLLGPWIPEFCEDIRKNTGNGFYSHLADCLDHFVESEASTLTQPTVANEMGKDHAERIAV
ncbi:MAG: molecular chaperone TorD family protein [Proteobacteria bacterium]|nr:molecular chaperone TorD family protein [Pseudomonadota bacterium]MBU1739781.1 molecular chaperone TorD family protein [Pseudomonadota bacterium]